MIPAEPVGSVVARGEAEIGFQQMSELKPISGIELVGMLPPELQRTSPIDTRDVAEAIVAILASPAGHIGKVYELTGPRSQDLTAHAAEYSSALGRVITYVDVPLEQWRDQQLRPRNLPEHVFEHLLTMAGLHAANRYDRLTHDVESITGSTATSTRDYVARHAKLFKP
jgi:NAD(P)H dehydrogenase (quinone)